MKGKEGITKRRKSRRKEGRREMYIRVKKIKEKDKKVRMKRHEGLKKIEKEGRCLEEKSVRQFHSLSGPQVKEAIASHCFPWPPSLWGGGGGGGGRGWEE